MTWQPDYCTLVELKAQLRITDTADDLALGVAITAASRAIDHETDRQFGLTGSPVARVYTYETADQDWRAYGYAYGLNYLVRGLKVMGRPALQVNDLMTTDGLAVAFDLDGDGDFEVSLTDGVDYDLWPFNAAADGKPWTHIVLRPTAGAFFPTWARAVQVTANWGWSTIPTVVNQGCLIQASRFFVRRDSAYGIAGSPDMGSEVRLLARLDPDVALLLTSVKRQWAAA